MFGGQWGWSDLPRLCVMHTSYIPDVHVPEEVVEVEQVLPPLNAAGARLMKEVRRGRGGGAQHRGQRREHRQDNGVRGGEPQVPPEVGPHGHLADEQGAPLPADGVREALCVCEGV